MTMIGTGDHKCVRMDTRVILGASEGYDGSRVRLRIIRTQ